MDANPPTSANSEHADAGALDDASLFVEHSPAIQPLSDETPGAHKASLAASEEKSPAEIRKPLADSSTPKVSLTAHQQRVLQYLARRRMRHARISKRSSRDHTLAEDAVPTVRAIPAEEVGADLPSAPSLDENKAFAIVPEAFLVDSSPQVEGNKPATPLPGAIALADIPPLPPAVSVTMPEVGKTIRAFPLKLQPLQDTEAQRRRRRLLRYLSRKHIRRARVKDYRAGQKVWLSIGSTLLSVLLVLLSVMVAGTVTAYQFYTHTQARYEHQVLTLYDLLPQDNLKMYDSKGVLLMQMTDQGIHTSVALNQVAPVLQHATIATEDKNFWTNQGLDILRIIRAALDDIRSGHVIEGGSTITQQLIKNLIVGNQTSLIRKLEELVLTPQVNSYYSKSDILQMYLNSIYYGHQAYGVDAAATVYFGLEDKPKQSAAMQLDLAQAALLAGIPSNPSANDPLAHPQAALQRFKTVLNLMMTQGYISKVDALDAIHEEQSAHFFKSAPSLTNRAPHFSNFVLSQLIQLFHLKNKSELSRSGMIVDTTLDINLQDKIQKIAQQHIAELRDEHNITNAAEVLIDFHSGAIISLLGSIDYNNKAIDGQFDVATQSYRQPGSSFKPYVYVTAFKQGASPAQAIDDTPTTIDTPDSNPPTYSPTNYDLHFHGHMTLRCALQNSLNVPAVRVLRHVGIDAAMQTARDMGITSYRGTPGYSLVLGGLGIRLLDHTSAMGTFANGGLRVGYYAINKVLSGTTSRVLYQHQLDAGKHVISPQLAYMMTNVLSDNTARLPEFYDCNVLQLYSNSQADCWNGNRGDVRPAAAKTGTTQNFRDNWTVGYTTDYVMGVWAGNDDDSPMFNVTGVMGAAPIWHDSMLLAEQGHPIRDFTNPGGLEQDTVTYADGVKATDWFLPGTAPVSVEPTPTPVPTAVPTATDSPTVTPTPEPSPGAGKPPTQPLAHPYCPSSYSFAFNPPLDDNSIPESGAGWW
ncbi:MAG: hypothetical protein NVSMB27_04380 [Ktedonobacteraceae bacterium]